MLGNERAAIEDVLTRFLRAFVSGDRSGLAYSCRPERGSRASTGGFELLDVGSLAALGDTAGRARLVLVTARVRDSGVAGGV